MTNHVVTIARSRNGHYVTYSSMLNGERGAWNEYETTETVAEIRAYVASTYPKLNPIFVIVEE